MPSRLHIPALTRVALSTDIAPHGVARSTVIAPRKSHLLPLESSTKHSYRVLSRSTV